MMETKKTHHNPDGGPGFVMGLQEKPDCIIFFHGIHPRGRPHEIVI